MNKRHVFYVGLVLLAALVLFGAPMAAMAAAHPNVTLKTVTGATVSGTTPYSPKQTCGGCHFDCATGQFSITKASWCTAGTQSTNLMDYEYQSKITNHVQGGPVAGYISLSTHTITGPLHGASSGFHSAMGRNEELTNVQRTLWGNPASISSEGMWGRF